MSSRFRLQAVLAVTAMLASFAIAASPPGLSTQAILDQQQAIRQEVEVGKGPLGTLSERERAQLSERQARVERALEGVEHSSELSERDRIALTTDLDWVRTLVDGKRDERQICQRHRPIGSNRPVTVCKTVAHLREEREKVERDIGRRTLQCAESTWGPDGCRQVR